MSSYTHKLLEIVKAQSKKYSIPVKANGEKYTKEDWELSRECLLSAVEEIAKITPEGSATHHYLQILRLANTKEGE